MLIITFKKFSHITFLFLLFSILFSLPEYAFSGEDMLVGQNNTITDIENSRLIGYWDLRDRSTYFQVTNTNAENARIHIQIYNVGTGCTEFDYYDTLTPRDTHVYDISNLDRNNGAALSAPDLSDGHGIIAITHVNPDDSFNEEPVLTGNFRILDSGGYEYRTNLAGPREYLENPGFLDIRVNFNNVDGTNSNDLVIIALDYTIDPGGVEPLSEVYGVTLYDENENPISCPPVLLGCLPDFVVFGSNAQTALGEDIINVGIDQAITNSRGGPSLCLGTNTTGFLHIWTDQSAMNVGYFAFIGLNNGNSTGSMDSAIHIGGYQEIW